jgi:uncharacterized RDD family membrane protein YckC
MRHNMEQPLSQYQAGSSQPEATDVWRNELQDRLARYKRRRGRPIEGAFTMRFPFPPDEVPSAGMPATVELEPESQFGNIVEPVEPPQGGVTLTTPDPGVRAKEESSTLVDVSPAGTANEPLDLALEAPLAPEEEPAPFFDSVPRPRPKRKVIAFPKHLSAAPEMVHRLADPVMAETPRILDVPEELEAIPATPFLDGLHLDLPIGPGATQNARDRIDLPCQPVRISQRILAEFVDLVVISLGVAVFASVAYNILQTPPLSKPLVLGLLAGFVVLWSAYQYLFLVYGGKTPGMTVARLRLRNFKGKVPAIRQRRLRVLGQYLSSLSLGMGLMWAFVDIDSLCWHDRLSQTFLTGHD